MVGSIQSGAGVAVVWWTRSVAFCFLLVLLGFFRAIGTVSGCTSLVPSGLVVSSFPCGGYAFAAYGGYVTYCFLPLLLFKILIFVLLPILFFLNWKKLLCLFLPFYLCVRTGRSSICRFGYFHQWNCLHSYFFLPSHLQHNDH